MLLEGTRRASGRIDVRPKVQVVLLPKAGHADEQHRNYDTEIERFTCADC
jgi:hypothetical protein